jgi:uncharacterized protein (DUF58 family)
MALLDPSLLQRLARITLRSDRRGAGVRAGERKSIRRGNSQEFADHRPYVPGDDLRFLDWHLYGRLDTLWIKLFEEEDDRVVQVLLDCSASMAGEKLDYARRIAAAIAFVALGHGDRVAVAGLTDRLASFAPARRGAGQATEVFRTIEAIPSAGRTGLEAAIDGLPRQRGTGIVLLFSDFLADGGAEPALRRLLARGGQAHVFHVVAPFELSPDLVGDVQLVDRETGDEILVSLDEAALGRYRATVEAWLARIAAESTKLGVGYTRLLTSVPVEEAVLRDLRAQGVLG